MVWVNITLLCLLTCNTKLSIINRLSSRSQLGQKGSGIYYSNLFLFVYFQFILEPTFYHSFCNLFRIFFFHKKKIGIHTVHPTDHRVNEIFYLFGPVVFDAIGFTQGFCLLKPTSREQKTKDSPITDFSIILQRHTAVTQHSMVIFAQATVCSKQDQNEPTHTYNTRCQSSFINPSFKGNIYANSFFPKTIKDWNPLALNIRKIETFLNALFGNRFYFLIT